MSKLASLAIGLLYLFYPIMANAYVGPGAGLSAIGSFLALIVGVLVAILGFLWYPLKRLIKSRNGPTLDEAADSTDTPAVEKSVPDAPEK